MILIAVLTLAAIGVFAALTVAFAYCCTLRLISPKRAELPEAKEVRRE